MSDEAPRNFQLFACGRKGSGKSHLLARFRKHFRKVVILDSVSEHIGRVKGARECFTLKSALDVLAECAPLDHWTIIACLSADDMQILCGVLIDGYAKAVGGVVVENGEIEMILPNVSGGKTPLHDMLHRGRHYRVSSLLGSRRPQDVPKLLTSQVDVFVTFRQWEPRIVNYIGESTSEGLVQQVRQLRGAPFYEHLEFQPDQGLARIVDKNGQTIRKIDPATGDTV